MHGDHVRVNRDHWTENAESYAAVAPGNWESEPSWGIWSIPETEARLLPDVTGLDVVELGCGTAYVSAWMKRRGARSVVGLDPTWAQLTTAQQMQARFSLPFALVQADAECCPFASECFDVAVSEYGAAIWCDPSIWIPQAFRILRPGGRLIFLGNSVLTMLTAPPGDTPCGDALLRPLFGMRRLEWDDTNASNFCLPHGEMLRLLRETGFEVEALHELRAPEGDDDEVRYFVRRGWARQWPCEDVWVARRRPE
jgi:SAM-dependent methyltransferase